MSHLLDPLTANVVSQPPELIPLSEFNWSRLFFQWIIPVLVFVLILFHLKEKYDQNAGIRVRYDEEQQSDPGDYWD